MVGPGPGELPKEYTRISLSSLPLAIRLSERPTHVTGPRWPVTVLSHFPLRAPTT